MEGGGIKHDGAEYIYKSKSNSLSATSLLARLSPLKMTGVQGDGGMILVSALATEHANCMMSA